MFKFIIIVCCLPLYLFAKQPPIKLGMSAAFSGPSAELGTQLKVGALAYFDQVNAAGGINQRPILLIARDDKYEPDLTVSNTRYFVETEKVDALFSYVGTPTSHAIQSIVNSRNIPFITPFTGAQIFRNKANIFHLRASYYDEAKVQINHLVNDLGYTRIAFLIQADEFGLSVQSGLKKAMAPYGLSPVKVERFKRNSSDIEKALNRLKDTDAQAICLVGTYKPLAYFINLAAKQEFTPQFTTVSFASSEELFARLNQPSKVVVTEVVPDVKDCEEPWCKRFIKAMAALNISRPTRVHLEGYANAYSFYQAAKQCKVITRECLLEQLSNVKYELEHAPRFSFEGSKKVNNNTVFLNHFDFAK